MSKDQFPTTSENPSEGGPQSKAVKKPKEGIQCHKCDKTYRSERALFKHVCSDKDLAKKQRREERAQKVEVTEKNKIFKCNRCEKEYKTQRGIDMHVCKEQDVALKFKKLTCKKCDVVLTTLSGLGRHTCRESDINKKKAREKIGYDCEYCDRHFKTERGLTAHRCTNKLRSEEVKTQEGRVAFFAYHFYFRYSMSRYVREKTIGDFIRSKLYNDFLRFGKYVVRNKMTRYEDYIKYLHSYSVPITDWANDKVYHIYVKNLTMREPMESAVERTFSTMTSWAAENNDKWFDYFRKENKYRIIHHVKTGKISPWVIYNSTSGEDFINRLSGREVDEIFEFIDPAFWGTKFTRYSVHAVAARSTLKDAGL